MAKETKTEKKSKTPKINILNKFKKNNSSTDDDGLDILTEVKEPFSIQNFFETHIVERAKRIKNTLAEKGILFFLFSPFQARSRLIAQILILCIGVAFGVIPRMSSLVSALQDQAYASEIAGLSEKSVGSLTITPAASSNYKKTHMLAFVLTGKNLPSDASKYEVYLSKAYGASDWEDVTYSWSVYPVNDEKRILLVAVDQSKQASGYGAFNLYIQKAGDEDISKYEKEGGAFEITLSTAQDTTDLYDKNGIHLAPITEAICGKGDIAKKQADFEEALTKYQAAVEQAEAMPGVDTVSPTKDELETYCLSERIYRMLDDDSTTEDIIDVEKEENDKLSYDVILTCGGIPYDSERVKELRESEHSDEEEILFNEFDHVNEAKNSVISAMESVNLEAELWYNMLKSYELILNQTLEYGTFPLYARCTASLDEPINFIDGGSEPDDEEPGGLYGTVSENDPLPEKPVIKEEEPAEEPVVTEEPEPEEELKEEPVKEPEEKPEEKPEKKPTPPYKPSTSISGDPADSK